MATDQNFESEERKSGSKAAAALRGALRSKVKSVFNRRSGKMEASTVSARYRVGRLDRLVMTSPHYSFKAHFGSTKTGSTNALNRGGTNVSQFERHVAGRSVPVKAHARSGGEVRAHRKGIDYKATNHIADALKSTPALDTLATELGNNRIVKIVSQIDF